MSCHHSDYFQVQSKVLPIAGILSIDTQYLEKHIQVNVEHQEGRFLLFGPDAINLLMLVKPSALEGRRLKWLRHAWSKHNIIGHPVMQVLAWFGYGKLGLRYHEHTVPKPQPAGPRCSSIHRPTRNNPNV